MIFTNDEYIPLGPNVPGWISPAFSGGSGGGTVWVPPDIFTPSNNSPANPAPDDLGTPDVKAATPQATTNTTAKKDESDGYDLRTVLIGAAIIVGGLMLLKK